MEMRRLGKSGPTVSAVGYGRALTNAISAASRKRIRKPPVGQQTLPA
jgi:hypothetical protein